MVCSTGYGMGPTASASGGQVRRNLSTSAAPSPGSPTWHKATAAAGWNCNSSGTNGAGGAVFNAASVVISSGSSASHWSYSARTSPARSPRYSTNPPSTVDTGCAVKVNEVTTPKLPPPPRTAQNRAGCWSSSEITVAPSAVTTSTCIKLSLLYPYRRDNQPIPPPRVKPPTPVVEINPPGVANPWSPAAASRAPQVQPPPARIVRAVGSTTTAARSVRSISTPVSQTPSPATLCPPPRTATGRSCSRANRIAAATSSGLMGRTISAGYRSIIPFHTNRAAG